MAGVYQEECLRRSRRDEPLTLTSYYSCGLSQLYKALGVGGLFVAEAIKGKFPSLLFSSSLFLWR